MSFRPLAAEELLRVDHGAALAKLATAQLQGTWQLPTELVRLAVCRGALSVAFELTASRLILVVAGAHLPRALLVDLAAVLDPEVAVEERHRALIALEGRDAFAFSALAGLPSDRLTLRSGPDFYLERRGESVRVVGVPPKEEEALGFEMEVEGLELDPRRAKENLERTVRFAPVPVRVGGVEIARGFESILGENVLRLTAAAVEGQQRPGLETRLAMPRRGHTPRLWLLRHGVVAARATVPGFPAFEAAVEMAPLAAPGPESTAAALREGIGPYMEHLVDASIRLNLSLAENASRMSETVRSRTAQRLLEAARKRRRAQQIAQVPLFPRVSVKGRRLVSLEEIRAAAGEGGVEVVGPEQPLEDVILSERGVLVLGGAERALLGELLDLPFAAPPIRARPGALTRFRERLEELASGLFGGAEELSASDLDDGEQGFLNLLEEALRECEAGPRRVAFIRGDGAPRHRGTALLLPRENAMVRACRQTIAAEPRWLYPAVVYLLGDKGRPSESLRKLWQAT